MALAIELITADGAWRFIPNAKVVAKTEDLIVAEVRRTAGRKSVDTWETLYGQWRS